MRTAVCPRCKFPRVVVRLKMDQPWKIRQHFWPGKDMIGQRRANGLCPGSGERVREELVRAG